MNNEQYLLVSYSVIAMACMGLAFATFTLLRCSFATLTNDVPGGRLGRVFRRLFLVGIVLFSIAGFFSVTFRSCDKRSYQAIVEDRSYLVAKNQEQLGASLSHIAIALLVWGGMLSIGFLATNGRKKTKEATTIFCMKCGFENVFHQPYLYHSGFSDVYFLYNNAGNLTLVWSVYDTFFERFFAKRKDGSRGELNRRELEEALPPAPKGGRWGFKNPARCLKCGNPITKPEDIHYVKYDGSIDLDRDMHNYGLKHYIEKGI